MPIHSRGEVLRALRAVIDGLKGGPWPPYWRPIVSRTVANKLDGPNGNAGSVNAIISTLSADEWDSLKLPESVASVRPRSAVRAGEDESRAPRHERQRIVKEKKKPKSIGAGNGHAQPVAKKSANAPRDVLVEQIRLQYVDALNCLGPHERTCQNLARVLGKRQDVVDCYVRANSDFASQLLDGKDVFSWLTRKTG